MYSQCPRCQAIFNVPDPDVGAHHGLVRCGRCRTIFHAVTNEVGDIRIPPGDALATTPPGVAESPGEHRPSPPAAGHGEPASAADRQADDDQQGELKERPPDKSSDRELERGSYHGASRETAPRAMDEELGGEAAGETEPDGGRGPEPQARSSDDGVAEPPPDRPRDAGPDRDWIEAVLSGSRTDAGKEGGEFEGGIMEEILIEAPPVTWGAFEEEDNAPGPAGTPKSNATAEQAERRRGGKGASQGRRSPPPAGKAREPVGAAAQPQPDTGAQRISLNSPYRAGDIRMVELPQPKPFKTASLSLLAVFMGLLLLWQVKVFYLADLSQLAVLRPVLAQFCRPLGCVVPPRRDFAAIDLVGTSINVNPDVPGALEIKASLINRASFPQPYPPLRVTLTDRDGRIVGRRTYLASEYRSGEAKDLMPIKAVRKVSIDLAQPAQNAVGYQVELMAPIRGSS